MSYASASVTASGSASVRASDSASVRAYDRASVRAYDRASVRAYDRASVTAYDRASVMAYDIASVTASGSASVTASDSASVRASGHVFIRALSATVKISAASTVVCAIHAPAHVDGGRAIQMRPPATAEEWCEHYGVPVLDGVATLYKGVAADFRSAHGGDYAPGTIPLADDWDGGKRECGGGLHFSPHPFMTREFCAPEKFVACPVALADMRAPADGDAYPSKIKARGCCAPVWECDEDGKSEEAA
jgi:hypothetical protein